MGTKWGMMPPKLVDYGIQSEDVDVRVHVCFGSKKMYAYKPNRAMAVMNGFKEKEAMQGELVTAIGRLVPPHRIPGIKDLSNACADLLFRYDPGQEATLEEKKRAAEDVAREYFSRSFRVEMVTDKKRQLAGIDIELSLHVQVKCDYNGGVGGTGNLFIQTAECNPYGIH